MVIMTISGFQARNYANYDLANGHGMHCDVSLVRVEWVK